jgi:hypothetical protein
VIRISRAVVVATATATVLVLSACSQVEDLVGGTDEPSRDESGQVTESAAAADVFSIKVGDCIGSFGDGEEVQEIPVVPCDEPHDQEVYARHEVPDADEFPGLEAVQAMGDEQCAADFAEFVGLDYDESALYLSYLTPTKDSWAQGDREILCVIYEDGAQTTGTLKDAQR